MHFYVIPTGVYFIIFLFSWLIIIIIIVILLIVLIRALLEHDAMKYLMILLIVHYYFLTLYYSLIGSFIVWISMPHIIDNSIISLFVLTYWGFQE